MSPVCSCCCFSSPTGNPPPPPGGDCSWVATLQLCPRDLPTCSRCPRDQRAVPCARIRLLPVVTAWKDPKSLAVRDAADTPSTWECPHQGGLLHESNLCPPPLSGDSNPSSCTVSLRFPRASPSGCSRGMSPSSPPSPKGVPGGEGCCSPCPAPGQLC